MKNAAHDLKAIWHCIQVWFCFGSAVISHPSGCLWAPFIMPSPSYAQNLTKVNEQTEMLWSGSDICRNFHPTTKEREGETGKPWPFDLHPVVGRAASEVAWVIKTLLPWRLAWVQMREQGYRRGLCCQEHPAKRLPGLWGLYPSLHESTFVQRRWVHRLTSNQQLRLYLQADMVYFSSSNYSNNALIME